METKNYREKATKVGQIAKNTISGDVGRICEIREIMGTKYSRFASVIEGDFCETVCPLMFLRVADGGSKRTFRKKINKLGLRWSSRKNEYIKIQREVEKVDHTLGEKFYYINETLDVVMSVRSESEHYKSLEKVGNYFRTLDEAKEAAERVKSVISLSK